MSEPATEQFLGECAHRDRYAQLTINASRVAPSSGALIAAKLR
jgi:hypothetical protein